MLESVIRDLETGIRERQGHVAQHSELLAECEEHLQGLFDELVVHSLAKR